MNVNATQLRYRCDFFKPPYDVVDDLWINNEDGVNIANTLCREMSDAIVEGLHLLHARDRDLAAIPKASA